MDQRRIRELPQMLAGLELRRVGGEKQQVDILGYAHLWAGMPPGAVEHQHDLLAETGAYRCGRRGQFGREELRADARGQAPDDTSGGGMHEDDEVAPVVAWLDRPLPRQRPDALEQRFDANAVFIGGPHLNRRVGGASSVLPAQSVVPFIKAPCSSGLAATWCGRGHHCAAGLRALCPGARLGLGSVALDGDCRAPHRHSSRHLGCLVPDDAPAFLSRPAHERGYAA